MIINLDNISTIMVNPSCAVMKLTLACYSVIGYGYWSLPSRDFSAVLPSLQGEGMGVWSVFSVLKGMEESVFPAHFLISRNWWR